MVVCGEKWQEEHRVIGIQYTDSWAPHRLNLQFNSRENELSCCDGCRAVAAAAWGIGWRSKNIFSECLNINKPCLYFTLQFTFKSWYARARSKRPSHVWHQTTHILLSPHTCVLFRRGKPVGEWHTDICTHEKELYVRGALILMWNFFFIAARNYSNRQQRRAMHKLCLGTDI